MLFEPFLLLSVETVTAPTLHFTTFSTLAGYDETIYLQISVECSGLESRLKTII